MLRGVALYGAVVVVSLLRAVVMPFVLPFRSSEYRLNYYLAEDQAWNTVGNGKPDECISARAHRRKWQAEKLIDWLFNDPEHCKKAYESERTGSQNAPEYKQ